MTLYWYMHWFWITCYLYVGYCETVTTHSIAKEMSKNATININGSIIQEEISNLTSIHIPPIKLNSSNILRKNISETTESTIKTSKPVYKKPLKLDMTRKVTISPSNRNKPVIEEDIKFGSYNSSNQTTINVFNQTENITFSKDELLFNQSYLHNLEQIKKDGDVPVISAAGIVGITLGCITIIASVIFISFILYRNRGLNRPQVLNDHCSNLDSSGYIDDASIRDNSEEMYSLDNDSFLNSLEAMTIQNYWTDTVKHTKL